VFNLNMVWTSILNQIRHVSSLVIEPKSICIEFGCILELTPAGKFQNIYGVSHEDILGDHQGLRYHSTRFIYNTLHLG
jgi:hypothetical protein